MTVTWPSTVKIFDGSGSPVLDMHAIASFTERAFPATEVESLGDLPSLCLSKLGDAGSGLITRTATELAAARVVDISKELSPDVINSIPRVLIDYERRMLERKPPRPVGVMYDGFALADVYAELLRSSGIHSPADLAVVITDQLPGTFDLNDFRYHARVMIFGDPCIISTTGLVEAPARPRGYYINRQTGIGGALLEDERSGEWLHRDDPRTTEVVKGYLAQALFFYATGEPFCDNKDCRLFNAHRQDEMLRAQLHSGHDFCEYHERLAARVSTGG